MLIFSADDIKITGGFQYDGHMYRLMPGNHVLLTKEVAEKVLEKPRAFERAATIVSKKELGKLNEGSNGEKHRCGVNDLEFNKKQSGSVAKLIKAQVSPEKVKIVQVPRKARDQVIKDATAGCPVNPQQLTIAVVADCNYVKALGGRTKARENILNDMNLVAGIYLKTFNIDLSINSVELLDKCEDGDSFNVPCKDYPGLDAVLNRFSKWRDGRSNDAGIYHLVTSCNYSDTVGLAWVNQVCRTTSFTDSAADIVSGTSVSVLVENQFTVIAHELGHSLGAIHDCTFSHCDGSCTDFLECQCCQCEGCNCMGKFLMDPENGGIDAVDFSMCSIKDICDKVPYIGTCLKDPGAYKKDLIAVCGNGIREGDEECDCGGEAGCKDNRCCTKDCKYTSGSKCNDSNDVCCRDCQLITPESKQVCRIATSSCQEDAFCDGKTATCPAVVTKADGETCGDGLQCASGICTSRDLQCSIFGRHLNVTTSCKYTKRSCTILCQGPDQCVDMNANFIDGTACGEKGYCYQGMCSEFGSYAPSKSTVVLSFIRLLN